MIEVEQNKMIGDRMEELEDDNRQQDFVPQIVLSD